MKPREFGERVAGKHYVDRPGAYAVIRSSDGRISLLEKNGRYFLPGGGLEKGETPQEALHREVREETGLTVTILREIGRADQFLYAAGERTYFNKRGIFYEASRVATASPTEPDGATPGWFAFPDVEEFFAHASQLWAVRRVLF